MVKPLLSKHVTKFLNTRHYQSWRVVFCTMVLVAKIRLFLHSTNYSFCYPLYYTSDIIFIPPPQLPLIPLPPLPLFHFRHHPPSTAHKSTSSTSASRHRRHRLTDIDDVDLEGVEQRGKEDVPLPHLHLRRYHNFPNGSSVITTTTFY